jgi:hypothetical protein
MPFIQRVGIPSIDQAFVRNQHDPDPAYENVGKALNDNIIFANMIICFHF